MSWDSAVNVLYAASPTLEQVDALQAFVRTHKEQLTRCYAPEFRGQRLVLCRFVAQLFVVLETPEVNATPGFKKLQMAVEAIADLLAREDFFTGVFDHALREGDVPLLELVDSALFTEIVFDSDLTRVWFAFKRKYEDLVPRFSPLAQALITIVSVQFLDVRQDWSACNPSAKLLNSLNEEIVASEDLPVKLAWNLALYNMAQSYYTSEQGDDAHGIESLMQSMQARAGVHWSKVRFDELQRTLPGIDGLIKSLEVVELNSRGFSDGQLLAQTVADVISCLFTVSKPTESLCAALAAAVSPWPALQRVNWVSDKYVALTKSKAPASIGALISLAQCMDTPTRLEYLTEMRTYVSVADSGSLGLDKQQPVCLGQDVRTTKLVTVLPPRPTDHQGTLELEPGTRGTLLAMEGSDCLVMWYFTYNGWSLLGRILENNDLTEGDNWSPLTTEILKLVTMTLSTGVQTIMSVGLARGDVVDLVTDRLQSWIHNQRGDMCTLAFEFLLETAKLDPTRVWVILANVNWNTNSEVLNGARRLLLVLWPSFDVAKKLHQQAVQKLVALCAEHYSTAESLDFSILQVFEHLLPVYPELQEELLGDSPLRETVIAPLMANIERQETLDFCSFCVELLNSGDRLELSFLEKQLFTKSRELAQLFASHAHLRASIMRLWTALMSYPEAPPLLAFLPNDLAKQFREELVSIAGDKLEPIIVLHNLARFLISARRQESLIDLLWEPLLPIFEDRLKCIEDSATLATVIRALTLLRGQITPKTLELLQETVRNASDSPELAVLEVKAAAIDLISKQTSAKPESLSSFYASLGELIPQLTKIDGIRPSLHTRLMHNLRDKWPSETTIFFGSRNQDNGNDKDHSSNNKTDVQSQLDDDADLDLDLAKWDFILADDPIWKSSYRAEMVEAIENKQLIDQQAEVVNKFCDFIQNVVCCYPPARKHATEWATKLLEQNNLLLPPNLQLSESKRLETGLVLLVLPSDPSVELLDLIYHQLTDIVQTPTAKLSSLKKNLITLMQMAALVLSRLSYNKSDTNLRPILLGLLDVVVIKQVQIFGSSEETLKLHLLLLRSCLRLLNDPVAPRSLVQSMTESGTDATILNAFMNTPVDKPVWGELLMLYVQEWLPTDIMTDNFVRNGLMNVLIEAPLGRVIQGGDVIAGKLPALHSLWCQGMLTIILRLIKQLGSRIAQEAWLFVATYASQISTCQEQWRAGQISMKLIEETLLIYALLKQLNQLDSSPNDKVDAGFDGEEVVKMIDVLLSHQKYLAARVANKDDPDTVIAALREVKEAMSS